MSQATTSACFFEPTFQTTKRGGRMLCRAGYTYIMKRVNKDASELWRCTNKNKAKCNATIKFKVNPYVILHETVHNHAPKDEAELTIEGEMNICSERVQKNINVPVTQIFEESLQTLQDKGLNFLKPLPNFRNIKNKLYRVRNKSQGVTKLQFHKACDLEVPTNQNLLFAEYKDKKKRILVFAKKEMIKYLKESSKYFMDGTFKICPKCFCQVYTLHADIGSNEEYVNVVPVLYALLPDKTRATYEILFQMIKSQVKEWKPTHISMDFEVSAILAIRNLFPDVKIVGCYFHFNRSLWRKAKQLGLNKSKLSMIHVKLCVCVFRN
ncbi:uncharacterized protein LOC124642701 [Helicoverpa zea]|uniref:uncharacterized protein LOC124642700 n=1 Tax=Helicoverpa zea TaxID=7113 RepID=UPI001F582EB8|nr:uncharacterized protein LOC124642700 [Helicoverpa zea]XP_047037259.1 uncharacterized protein LOC124642701 [Helicoverpa zea]